MPLSFLCLPLLAEQLFQYKTAIFQQEVLSAIITPVILCFSLPEVSPR
jgi:hypothetical protein